MKRFIFMAAVLALFCSCADREVIRTLDDVESYIMERPDSALKTLESIDRAQLTTKRSRAQHALLHAMALDKNYIDVTDDSLALIAVNYYKDHKPQKNYARALYYLGKCYYYRGEYDKAILEYSKAEKIAEECDSLYLGMIKTGQANTYNKTYNSIEELRCIQEAVNILHKLGLQAYERPAKYYLGIAYHNINKFDEAIIVFKELIESSTSIDYCHVLSTIELAHTMIESENVDYQTVDSLFKKAKNEHNAEFTERDLWAWAYSLYRIGKPTEAEEIIRNITASDESTANLWRKRIAVYLKDYKSAYDYDLCNIEYQNSVVRGLLEESLATYQRDYYQAELESAEYRVKTRTIGMIAAIIIAVLIFAIIYFLINKYAKKKKEENNKLFEYAEEIKRQLNEAKMKDYPTLKNKYLSLYKSRFETIGALSEQYIQAEGRSDIESLMLKKVLSLINEVKNDSSHRAKFEAMLDEDLDMIMTNLRNEMPKFSENDYSIFSYLIVGFDAATISRFLDISVNNIYAHKRRIRIRIEKHQPEHASQFLEILS